MGLVQVTAAVEARMAVTMPIDAPSEKVPSFGLGWQAALKRGGLPPRIVWVPRSGPTKRPVSGGGDSTKTAEERRTSAPVAAPLWSRMVGIDAHIWATDISACEVLAGRMLAALNDVAWGAYSVVAEDWESGSATEDTARGQILVVRLQLEVPWTRTTSPAVLITTASVTSSDPMAGN